MEKGQLANGLTYFIRKNAKPEKRASLYLAVAAGSVLEDDDQRGLAHLIEHMAFNGTKKFAKQEIVNVLEKMGMRFGMHTNAYTSFDETVYTLSVPTDKPELVAQGIQILQQFASDIAFDPEETNKERGVVIEEWRSGRDAETRVQDKQLPVLFFGSRYAERAPIGDKKTLESADLGTIKRFYKDWYRPNLMAVVAVGDFDPQAIKQQIETQFGPLTNPANARPKPVFATPGHTDTKVSLVTDKELTDTSLTMVLTLPPRPQGSARDYRRMVVENVFHEMLNARLAELSQAANAPFLGASSVSFPFGHAADLILQAASVKPDGVQTALAALTRELTRVATHGFTQTEFDRARISTLRSMQSHVEERLKTPSRVFADEIVRHFLNGEAMPGIEAELAMHERFLGSMQLGELNQLAAAWNSPANRALMVSAPATATLPSDKELLATVQKASAEPTTAYVDKVATGPLVRQPPQAGRITGEKQLPAIGVTVWTLSNGVRVAFKPTDFQNDRVLVQAFSPGGTSLVKDADYVNARYANSVVDEGGLADFSPVQLSKALAGKLVSVSAVLDELEEGLWGSSAVKDLSTLFELIYLTVTEPRVDAEAFAAWKARQVNMLQNRASDPRTAFRDALSTVLYNRHRRRLPPTVADVEAVDMNKALAIYKDRFADVHDMTFVIVGNVDPETLRPLVQTYLAALPGTQAKKVRKETWKDIKARLARGSHKLEVRQGVEPRADVQLTFTGSMPWSRQAEFDVSSLADAVEIRLREVVREDLSGSYSVNVRGELTRRPTSEFEVAIWFGCAPERTEALTAAVLAELEKIKAEGLGDDYTTKIKMAEQRQHEVNLKSNGFWIKEIADAMRYGDDPQHIIEFPALIDTISTTRLRDTARKVFDTKHFIKGVLLPEGGTRAVDKTAQK
ncbi:MAG: insulinase family protein [Deltaproteobacteria bacterium]|nr:insulinase family protein [Deltaproteobacteria bacterium]